MTPQQAKKHLARFDLRLTMIPEQDVLQTIRAIVVEAGEYRMNERDISFPYSTELMRKIARGLHALLRGYGFYRDKNGKRELLFNRDKTDTYLLPAAPRDEVIQKNNLVATILDMRDTTTVRAICENHLGISDKKQIRKIERVLSRYWPQHLGHGGDRRSKKFKEKSYAKKHGDLSLPACQSK